MSNQRSRLWALAAVALATWGRGADYDPLAPGPAPRHQDFVVQDEGRQREIPLRVYLPATAGRAPVVLFSQPGDLGPRNPNHHRAILAFSTAFWDAYLGGDVAARGWLQGPRPRAVLEERDRWQRK
jgi:hypothetical protein